MSSDASGILRGSGHPGRNAYAELLRDTRGLRREQQQAREAWFARLAADKKEETLFELEILLKGVACFANPRNHPGAGRRQTIVSHDFHEHLQHARDGMARVVQLTRTMLGDRDRAFVFQRYLETVLPEDTARTRLLHATMAQESPESSLFVLRHGFTNLIEVAGGLLRLPRVNFRLFYAHLATAMREIAQSAFFNPLHALEFRPEFDRIASTQVLELIQRVPGEQAHRLVALTFLALFRMLRYLRLLDAIAVDHSDRHVAGRGYLVLAVLRSDARALSNYLRRRAGSLLADSFERDLMRVAASDIVARHDELAAEGHRLLATKAALTGLAANLRLEMRRAFEHDLPPADALVSESEYRVRLRAASHGLRPALQNAILFLGRALGAKLEGGRVFDDQAARRATSDRLRRDVWMFAQIARAFASKARQTGPAPDRWTGIASFAFVREFLSYFKAMGYPLLRVGDYPRVDAFIAAMTALEDSDLLDPQRLDAAIRECEAFHEFLMKLFEQISKREDLVGVPFDRKGAARALRLYLGERT
ncbi:hypothetical protein SOCEGT47_015740 [Sorangium cellulosum]|uniref:Uncharacterized protein n=1 Tax=Sorangium cellulosum TaxID=56 RepID=A0A4P2PX41_SORCE|nr:hypothetical protein [Sorangium cellulosum]AUX21096.1 hypothetical protein SOCEGT47_015740 [Sorangium cellulosum]